MWGYGKLLAGRSQWQNCYRKSRNTLLNSRLDKAEEVEAVWAHQPASLIQRLQSVQNAAARLIFNMRRSELIADTLVSLHWLCVPERIVFKVAVLIFRALCRLTWRLSLLVLLTCLTGEGCDLHRLISSTFLPSVCQLSVVVRFRLLVLRSETAYQMMSPPLCPCPPSGAVWRVTYYAALTTQTNSAYYTLTIVVLVVALLLRPL